MTWISPVLGTFPLIPCLLAGYFNTERVRSVLENPKEEYLLVVCLLF